MGTPPTPIEVFYSYAHEDEAFSPTVPSALPNQIQRQYKSRSGPIVTASLVSLALSVIFLYLLMSGVISRLAFLSRLAPIPKPAKTQHPLVTSTPTPTLTPGVTPTPTPT
jgi:hypothetical protein